MFYLTFEKTTLNIVRRKLFQDVFSTDVRICETKPYYFYCLRIMMVVKYIWHWAVALLDIA